MALSDESILDKYWNSIDNVVIYFSNVSPYYIFSVLVSFFAVFVVCWYRNVNTCFTAESQTTNKPDIEQKCVDEEELETETAKLNDSLDSLITEEFVHNEINEPSEGNCGQISSEVASGGDGNFKLQKDEKKKKEHSKSDEEVDPCSIQPNPLSRFKKARQAAILERVTGDMSEEQLREEREAEASQIAAIWDLLQQQKEQFNIGSEQELQEQVHLYCL